MPPCTNGLAMKLNPGKVWIPLAHESASRQLGPMHSSTPNPWRHNADLRFGILTLATPNDYLKAIGLALSARVSNPGVPLAVACSTKVAPLVAAYFDHVIEEKPGLRGFVHKVYLDEYSPFEQTFFFDSDVLLFRPVRPYAETWGRVAYAAVGHYETGGVSHFGLDRSAIMRKLGTQRIVSIDGAGHALFTKPACDAVFELAREVTREYRAIAGDIHYADEDVLAIVMTKLALPPVPHVDFHSRHVSARRGTMRMDATKAQCEFVAVVTGQTFKPCMMHFAAREAPAAYTRQLIKLYRQFGVPIGPLLAMGIRDVFETQVRWPLGAAVRRFRRTGKQ